MKITFFDKTVIEVDDSRAQRIINAMNAGTELIEIDGDYFKTSAILSVKKSKGIDTMKMIGGAKYEDDVDRTPALELSDEQRQKNRVRIHQLRQQFYKRKQA